MTGWRSEKGSSEHEFGVSCGDEKVRYRVISGPWFGSREDRHV